MIECNVTLQLHCITAKQLYIKLIFLAWKQALHLEGSQDVTQEPHAKGDVSARGGVRKESLQQSLTSFHFHPVNCEVLKLSPETRNRSVSFFFFWGDRPSTYLPWYKHQHFDSAFLLCGNSQTLHRGTQRQFSEKYLFGRRFES